MHSIRRIPFVVALLIVVCMTPLGRPCVPPPGSHPAHHRAPRDHIHASLPRGRPAPGHPARPSTGARKGHAE